MIFMDWDETLDIQMKLLANIRKALKPIENGDAHSSIIENFTIKVCDQEDNFNSTGTTHMIIFDDKRGVYQLGYVLDSDIKKQIITLPSVYAEFSSAVFTDYANLAAVMLTTYIMAILSITNKFTDLTIDCDPQ